jgi:molecular chaperone HtpG
MTEQTLQFKAEIRQLLDILVHSLYTEREIFLRELVSNASDALNRFQFEQITQPAVRDANAELAITLVCDPDHRTLTIRDSGIGMTEEELIKSLGTIAHSGARAFLEAAREKGQNPTEIIGQFGVGFYSVFMVAEEVRVNSLSARPDAQPASWVATGGDEYRIEPSTKAVRGTEIIVKLKEEAKEFSEFYRVRQIIKTHSDFVAFPIYVEEAGKPAEENKPVNQQTALWRKPAKEVSEEDYKNFYQQFTFDFQEPLLHIHYSADAPVQVYSLLFVPSKADPGLFSARREDGLKLYNRKVLIKDNTRDLLPEYLRFVRGVVDTEDLPLNVSRESVQANAVIHKLKQALTRKVLRELEDLAKNDTAKYEAFWNEFGVLIKEGLATAPEDLSRLQGLARFHTTIHPSEWVSLASYKERAKAEQPAIYYILGDDQHSTVRSPHLDYFRKHGYEVLLLTDPVDAFLLSNLKEFDGLPLKNVAASDTELPAANEASEPEAEKLSDDALARLVAKFKAQLGARVSNVRTTDRLSNSPARLVDAEGSPSQDLQRIYRYMERGYQAPAKVLELNPSHSLVKQLANLTEPNQLLDICVEQIYDSALLIEGLHPDPANMIERIQQIMTAATQ